MIEHVQQFIIQGITSSGKPFRPSDWAERLCGVLSAFGPSRGKHSHLSYSVYVHPVVIDDLKCVAVDERLRQLEPLAYKFVRDFAKDNDLRIIDACALDPEPQYPSDRPLKNQKQAHQH